jgi:hypothetical protein
MSGGQQQQPGAQPGGDRNTSVTINNHGATPDQNYREANYHAELMNSAPGM